MRARHLLLFLCACAWSQEPGPYHVPDPNLVLNSGAEGQTMLVLPRGGTQMTLGGQWKRGDDRRDENGSPFHSSDRRFPDFRYAMLNFNFGLGRGIEFDATVPYAWGNDFFETPTNFWTRRNTSGQVIERCEGCTGITDVWGSLKWQAVRSSRFPLVIQGDVKFPEVYRHSNPYLGSRAHDFQLSTWTFLHNRHFWVSPKIGHLWRGGPFADSVTYMVDSGWRPSSERRWRGFYLRLRFDGNMAHDTGQPVKARDRFAARRELAPGHFFTYNDQEGHRATIGVGAVVADWNVEVNYARWLAWRNFVGFKEWSFSASRPMGDRLMYRGSRLIAAPTQQEARSRVENSIVLAPGEGYTATVFDWRKGQRRHDDQGRLFQSTDGRTHDFRFLTAYVAYGLPKAFEVSALVPYLWGQEAFEDPNRNFSHTGLNDIWLSVRKQFLSNDVLPLGLAAEFKFPEPIRHADRWLGELRHDIQLSLFSLKAGSNWWIAPKFGYKWREGAFSDELPYVFDAGYRPPFSHRVRDLYVKTVFDGNFSLGNASPAGPADRFGDRRLTIPPDVYFTFNEGAMHRVGYGFGVRLIQNWNVEIVNHEYYAWKNNNGYERDWTIGLARWF